MEILNTLYNLIELLVFVLGTIISIGLSLTIKQITGPLLVSLAAGAPGLPKTAVFAIVDTAAMGVATMNFGNEEVVMVVVYSLIVLAILVPLALEFGKRRSETAVANK